MGTEHVGIEWDRLALTLTHDTAPADPVEETSDERRPLSPLDWLVAVVTAVPAFGAFVAVRVLMKTAPDRRSLIPDQNGFDARSAATTRSTRASRSFVGFFIWCYRRSVFGWYLNRQGPRCCFIPSCTEYAERVVSKYGLWRGLLLIGDRFRRCRPTYPGSRIDFP
jgi:putative component of membrane protein insertase Oxa1/YidC/SpoIIIJ protein YidD